MNDGFEETLRVEKLDQDLVNVSYHRRWQNGLEIGGDFVFGAGCLKWLVAQLELAVEEKISEVEAAFPPDLIKVYIGGGQGYEDININAHNHRDPSAPYGKLYVISGMPRETARTLIGQLRSMVVSST